MDQMLSIQLEKKTSLPPKQNEKTKRKSHGKKLLFSKE